MSESAYRGPVDVVQLLPRLHFLHFPVGHAYLWEDFDGLTLVDTSVPGSAPHIADAVRGLGHDTGDVRRLLLTHFHGDHVGSAAEVAEWGDVTVYAHRADAPFIAGRESGPPPNLLEWERPLMESVRTQVPATPPAPVRVDHELEDGDVLEFGGGARVVAVPGHTPGSAAYYLPEAGVLLTGDTIARGQDGQVMLGVFNVDHAEAVRSFRKQVDLEPSVVCFGHGEPLTESAAARLRAAADRLP